jgi:MOSC domain-containing protein YiiM
MLSDMENRPCMFTGKVVHEDNPIIGHWNKFKPAASGRRGVTAWVEREGEVRVGDRVTLFVPDQRPWSCYELRELMHFDMNRPKIGTSSSGMSDITARLVKMLIAGMIFAVVMISCRL